MKGVLAGLAGLVMAANIAWSAEQFHPVPVTTDNLETGQTQELIIDRKEGKTQTLEATLKSDPHGPPRGGREGYWPLTPEGHKKFIYYIVDFSDATFQLPESYVHEMMAKLSAEMERQSFGKLTADYDFGGRFQIPYTNTDSCSHAEKYDWAEYVDSYWGEWYLQVYDGRIYLFPQVGSCWWGGMATTQGNMNLPNHDGYASQIWALDFNITLMLHEGWHNFAVGHGKTPPTPENPDGDEYGDPATVMGRYACDIIPLCLDEIRGLHAEHRAKMGWLAENARLITHDGVYTISATELEHPAHPQLLQIIVPGGLDYESMYIDYRTEGGDLPNVLIDGTPAPLHPDFTGGASVRKSLTDEIWNTDHFGTLRDGWVFTFPDYYPQYDFFTVEQLGSTPEEVQVLIHFKERPDDESWLNPEQCSDGINNDNDWSCDYDGCEDLPPQRSCILPWNYIGGASEMTFGGTIPVRCGTPETKELQGFGPMGEDVGDISSHLTLNGREYVAPFTPTRCGEYTISCSTQVQGAYTQQISSDVLVKCEPGYTCTDSGECRRVRIRRPSGRVGHR